ncbi:MAG: GtrA family protein [Eggerthellaceae bacterium]|nr:GtrA family protein [Eggerthellaceae bacterium]
MQQLLTQLAKFGVVGVIAFFIDYGTMLFLTEVFGVPYLASTTIGFIVAVIFNYLASMRYVFKHKEEMSRRREFIIFFVLSVIGLGLNDVLMFVGVDLIGVDYRITKIVVTAIVMVYNFITRKIFLDAGE